MRILQYLGCQFGATLNMLQLVAINLNLVSEIIDERDIGRIDVIRT